MCGINQDQAMLGSLGEHEGFTTSGRAEQENQDLAIKNSFTRKLEIRQVKSPVLFGSHGTSSDEGEVSDDCDLQSDATAVENVVPDAKSVQPRECS